MVIPSKQQGLLVTIAVHALALMLLLLLQMATRLPQKPAGTTVNFGYIDDGSGNQEPEQMQSLEPVTPAEVPPAAKSVPAAAPKRNKVKPAAKILTAEDKEAHAVKKQTQEEIDSLKRVAEDKELKRQAERERLRVEAETRRQEEVERQRVEDERKKQAQQQSQVNAIKGRIGKSFGGTSANSGSQGEGTGQAKGNQGDPTGTVDAKNQGPGGGRGAGISFSLDGRNVIGSLAKPEYTVNDYGDVVVTITVDKNGDVISAVPGGKGTTTTDSRLWEAARKAAVSAKFNRVTGADAPVYQKGTITYKFKLL